MGAGGLLLCPKELQGQEGNYDPEIVRGSIQSILGFLSKSGTNSVGIRIGPSEATLFAQRYSNYSGDNNAYQDPANLLIQVITYDKGRDVFVDSGLLYKPDAFFNPLTELINSGELRTTWKWVDQTMKEYTPQGRRNRWSFWVRNQQKIDEISPVSVPFPKCIDTLVLLENGLNAL